MSEALSDHVRAALDKPGLQALWRQARKQLERNGAEPEGSVRVLVADHRTASELGALLGRLRNPQVGSKIKVELSALDRTLRAGAAGRGPAEVVAALTGGPLLQKQTEQERRTRENEQLHRELLAILADVLELDRERTLLATAPIDTVLRVPASSATQTKSWQVYESALRAAAIWWPAYRAGLRMAEKQLAGTAFRDTKAWTEAKRHAFSYLVGRPFDQAVDEADVAIRISGPLVWKTDETIADAASAAPWIAVPARGVRSLGEVECEAVGIFVIENTEAFEKVCTTPGISDRWLCVWLQGNPSSRLLDFLKRLELPVAAWCDLDAYGVRMIANLEKSLERPVTPVGMSVELWRSGTKRLQTDDQLDKARMVAAQIASNGPASVRPLAAAIAATGDCCEHETLYPEVLPTLGTTLRAIEQSRHQGARPASIGDS
jgi:hypothetical protein